MEAAAAHLKTVPLVGTHLSGQYTVAILNRAPHQAAAKAFVKFLLSAAGQKILKGNGVTPIVPALKLPGLRELDNDYHFAMNAGRHS